MSFGRVIYPDAIFSYAVEKSLKFGCQTSGCHGISSSFINFDQLRSGSVTCESPDHKLLSEILVVICTGSCHTSSVTLVWIWFLQHVGFLIGENTHSGEKPKKSNQCDLVSPARGFSDRSACEGDRQRSEEEAWRRGGYIGTTAGLDIG